MDYVYAERYLDKWWLMKFNWTDRNTAITVSVFTFIAVVMYLPNLDDGLRANRALMFGLLAIAGCSLATIKKNIYISILMMFVVVHTYFNTYTQNVIYTVYQIALACVCYTFLTHTYERWGKYKEVVYNTICGISLLNVAVEIFQWFGLLKIGEWVGRSTGITGNPNDVSCILAITLPLFFRRKWVWCLPLMAIGLILARTTNGLIAALVVSGVYLTYEYRKHWFKVLMIFVALIQCGLLYVTVIDKIDIEGQLKGRGLIYKTTFQMANVQPLGWGYAQFEHAIPLMTASNSMSKIQQATEYAQLERKDLLDRSLWLLSGATTLEGIKAYLDKPENKTVMFAQAHNEYLEVLFSLGWMGLICLLMAVVSTIKKGFELKDKLPALCLTASLCTAIFFFPWQMIPTASLTIIYISIITGETT
jgi:hypothetical protein